jgi:hypothetical protein
MSQMPSPAYLENQKRIRADREFKEQKLRDSLIQKGPIVGPLSQETLDKMKEQLANEGKTTNKLNEEQSKSIVGSVQKNFIWGLIIGSLATVIIYKIKK